MEAAKTLNVSISTRIRYVSVPLFINYWVAIFSKSLHGSIAKGGTYKTINEEDATGISLYVDLLGGMKNVFVEKEKVLIEQNDFKNAENLIKQGYQIIFFKNIDNNIVNYAKSINCKYFFKNNKLIQV